MSSFNQQSFTGGLNLLVDDTRLNNNQYRIGFNLRNRYDVLDPVKSSVVDNAGAIIGLKQGILTFGEFVLLFVAGNAYYRKYNEGGWNKIQDFSMSSTAPRFWFEAIPVAVTNYGRLLSTSTDGTNTYQSAASLVYSTQVSLTAAGLAGNLPGLLVQDNVSQPQFIYLNTNGYPVCRTTQTYSQWNAVYGKDTNNYGVLKVDNREYVPVGNSMAWVDGILYIAAQDGVNILRSVSGRPLDFVVNVKPDGDKGGDAFTTAYTVGVGGISCLKGMNDGSLFVAASNSNFIVSKNFSNLAPKEFGEYTFIRKFLFEATCLNDRVIFDSLGDTKFIDLTGVRSFNAVQQMNSEGRNSVFTSTIAAAFKGIIQGVAAAILYDNYELYAVDSIFGPVIAVFDTVTGSWAAFDDSQTNGKRIKQFAKIELGVQRLFAITEDNQLYTLYSSTTTDTASVLTLGITATQVVENGNARVADLKNEVKIKDFRAVLNRITSDCQISLQLFVDNRASVAIPVVVKSITYKTPSVTYTGNIPDLNTQLTNVYWTLPNAEQGWKVAILLSWNNGSLTQFSSELVDNTPMNPLNSQGTVS